MYFCNKVNYPPGTEYSALSILEIGMRLFILCQFLLHPLIPKRQSLLSVSDCKQEFNCYGFNSI